MAELVHSRGIRTWQEHLRQGKFKLQFDAQTGTAQFYPRPANLSAADRPLEWRDASGDAEVLACTVVRVGASLVRKPPYLLGLVQLADGPRMLAIIEGSPDQVPQPGTRLRALVDSSGTPPLSFCVVSP